MPGSSSRSYFKLIFDFGHTWLTTKPQKILFSFPVSVFGFKPQNRNTVKQTPISRKFFSGTSKWGRKTSTLMLKTEISKDRPVSVAHFRPVKAKTETETGWQFEIRKTQVINGDQRESIERERGRNQVRPSRRKTSDLDPSFTETTIFA